MSSETRMGWKCPTCTFRCYADGDLHSGVGRDPECLCCGDKLEQEELGAASEEAERLRAFIRGPRMYAELVALAREANAQGFVKPTRLIDAHEAIIAASEAIPDVDSAPAGESGSDLS